MEVDTSRCQASVQLRLGNQIEQLQKRNARSKVENVGALEILKTIKYLADSLPARESTKSERACGIHRKQAART